LSEKLVWASILRSPFQDGLGIFRSCGGEKCNA